jgi:hypothetical protein
MTAKHLLFLALPCVLLGACAEVRGDLAQGCSAEALKPQVVEPAQPDEEACIQFSIDATQEPGTFHAPVVQSHFPFDPANQYRITVLSTSVDWADGPVKATPEGGWTGWHGALGRLEKYNAVCPRARMYQAVCAPSDANDHCEPADGSVFRPDEIGAVSCFANDWPRHYGNNSGCVAVRYCKIK